MNPVADVLHTLWRVAGDHTPGELVIETERGNSVILAVEDASLAIRGRGWEAAEPTPQRVALAEESRDRWTISELERAPEIGIRERIDLDRDEAAAAILGAPLLAERPIFHAIVPSKKAPASRAP